MLRAGLPPSSYSRFCCVVCPRLPASGSGRQSGAEIGLTPVILTDNLELLGRLRAYRELAADAP
jgi:hypothetical protein